ncbi:DUF937 domain-containing protein [Sphingomonas sp.]|uniref:DUF937 domain-containing protein n=1 Tax=Sphingomonas sp. TaxID=28214 RepID=UPI00286E44EA|nr:DUF937 domain-containing protein [Sphingomonas sp.]
MEMLNAINQEGGVEAVSRELGVDQQTAQTGISALLPAVLGGMQNKAEASPQGLGGLASILGGLGGGGLLSNVLAPQPTDVNQGNQVLGEIFGDKDTSRAVAADAAQKSGLSPDLLKKMLPIVAMLAAGYFAKRAGAGGGSAIGGGAAGGGLGGLLGSLLGGGTAAGGGNVLGSILGSLAGRR